MSEHGHELAVDLANLWKVGKDDLPQVAGEFYDAWLKLPFYPSNFYRSGGLGAGDPAEGAAPAWGNLAKALAEILWTTQENLKDTGVALCNAANDFAKTDATAEKEFEKRKKEMGSIK